MAKLLYASSAWWGFATVYDKHRIEAFVRHDVRLQLYGAADPTPTQLAEDADETLFSRIRWNRHHILYRFLPESNCHQHNLRPWWHNFSLSTKTDDRNFIIRQLFLDSYWCVVDMTIVFLHISHPNIRSCGLFNCLMKLFLLFYYYYQLVSHCEQWLLCSFAPSRIWTHDLLIASLTLYPLRHRATGID